MVVNPPGTDEKISNSKEAIDAGTKWFGKGKKDLKVFNRIGLQQKEK